MCDTPVARIKGCVSSLRIQVSDSLRDIMLTPMSNGRKRRHPISKTFKLGQRCVQNVEIFRRRVILIRIMHVRFKLGLHVTEKLVDGFPVVSFLHVVDNSPVYSR